MSPVVPSLMHEAVSRPADVAYEMERVSVEYASAVPAMIGGLHASIVGPPFIDSALQCHEFFRRPSRI